MRGFGFGREDEYSLLVKQKKKYKGKLPPPKPDICIAKMLHTLCEKYGALPYGDENNPDIYESGKLFEEGNASTRFIWKGAIIEGVILPTLGRVYREAIAPYLEISKVLVTNPFELAKRTRYGEQIAGLLARAISTNEYAIQIFNCVSDRKGTDATSCGMHKNHLVSRVLFENIFEKTDSLGFHLRIQDLTTWAQDLISFLVLHIIFSGAGKVGSDLGVYEAMERYQGYQISERADFVWYLTGNNTAFHRPFLNSRREPHADSRRFARLHLINGEGNRSPWALALDTGLTALFLQAMEDDAIHLDWYFENPVDAHHELSYDPSLNVELEIIRKKGGRRDKLNPLELVQDILSKLDDYYTTGHFPPWVEKILGEAHNIIGHLKAGEFEGEASQMLDWLIKRKFLRDYISDRLGDPDNSDHWGHPEIRELDIKYHRLDNENKWNAIKQHCEVRDRETFEAPDGLPSENEFWNTDPPKDCRSYLFWFMHQDPFLRERIKIIEWHRFQIWNTSPNQYTLIILGDPLAFGKQHLTNLMERAGLISDTDGPDFSQDTTRAKFIKLLKEHTKPYPVKRDQDGSSYRVIKTPNSSIPPQLVFNPGTGLFEPYDIAVDPDADSDDSTNSCWLRQPNTQLEFIWEKQTFSKLRPHSPIHIPAKATRHPNITKPVATELSTPEDDGIDGIMVEEPEDLYDRSMGILKKRKP